LMLCFVYSCMAWFLTQPRNNSTTPLDCWKHVGEFKASVAHVEEVRICLARHKDTTLVPELYSTALHRITTVIIHTLCYFILVTHYKSEPEESPSYLQHYSIEYPS